VQFEIATTRRGRRAAAQDFLGWRGGWKGDRGTALIHIGRCRLHREAARVMAARHFEIARLTRAGPRSLAAPAAAWPRGFWFKIAYDEAEKKTSPGCS